MMVRWQICVCRREVEKKFSISSLLATTPCTSYWEYGSLTCLVKSIGFEFQLALGPFSRAYLPVRGFVFFTRPNALIGTKLLWPCLNRHCRQVASSPFFQSLSRTPNKDIQNLWVCCLRREFKTCLVSVLCCSCACAPHFVKLKFHRAFLVWLHCSLCQV